MLKTLVISPYLLPFACEPIFLRIQPRSLYWLHWTSILECTDALWIPKDKAYQGLGALVWGCLSMNKKPLKFEWRGFILRIQQGIWGQERESCWAMWGQGPEVGVESRQRLLCCSSNALLSACVGIYYTDQFLVSWSKFLRDERWLVRFATGLPNGMASPVSWVHYLANWLELRKLVNQAQLCLEYAPPKFTCWNPTPQDDGSRRWGFGRWLGH